MGGENRGNTGYNRDMKYIKWLMIIAMVTLAGCNSQTNISNQEISQQESVALIYTAAAMTAESGEVTPQSSTPQPEATLAETPIPTAQPDYMIPVSVELNGLILRGGPGTLFSQLATFALGTQVQTLGMVPDGTWIKVRAPLSDGGTIDGWMFAQYLDLTQLEVALPLEEMSPQNTVSGVVVDSEGNPVDDVRVSVVIETENGELRDESTTNRQGAFQVYYPFGLADSARVEVVAVNCNSRIAEYVADAGCLVEDYFPTHWQETISLPQSTDLTFTYEKAAAYLEGKVVYQDGNGASEILVRATRQEDGVQSEQVTPVGGAFRLPLGLGTWEVVAVRFQSDGTALIGETRIYEVGADGEAFDPLMIPYIEIIER